MKKTITKLCLFLAMVLPLVVQADHLSNSLQMTARMNGANEVPAVSTDAQGLGIFTLNDAKDALNINISVSGLSGDITGIHIHEGAAGTNGGVVHDLSPFINGNRIQTTFTDLTDLDKFLGGDYYLNVHTAANPNGEIRAQIILESDFRYTALLTGDQEVPAVATAAVGYGVFNLSKSAYKLQIKAVVSGLSGPITGAHLHAAAAGMNGGVVANLTTNIVGNVITATVDPSAFVDDLRAGNIYLNIHTVANPNGEIRGQLSLGEGLYFDAFANGDQEEPPVATLAEGVGSITVSNDLSTINYDFVATGLSGAITGAHLHAGGAGMNGGVIVDLSAGIVNGNSITGSQPVSVAILNRMLRGGVYLNIHTDENPAGEIRGQVLKLAREAYSYDFSGGAEVPPTTSAGTGAGMVTIDRDQSNAHFMMVVSGLTAPIDAAHFHNGVAGQNGDPIYDLSPFFNSVGGAYGYWTENSMPAFANSPMFRSNAVYVNIHTATFPAGEIRANVIRSRDYFVNIPVDPQFSNDLLIAAKLSGDAEVPAVTTNATGVTGMYIDASRMTVEVSVSFNALSGEFAGMHIHEGAAGENGPVVFDLSEMVTGNRAFGSIDITPEQLTNFLTGAYYLNVHTDNNPNGELRGQLNLETDPTFRVDLDGDQEVPAVTTNAFGIATFNYTNVVNQLEVNVMLSGLSGPITGAHLHNAAAGENGPVVEDLTPFVNGNTIQGLVFPDGYLADLRAGNIYLNIHTAANPDGEIRGQLLADNSLVADLWLSGAQEVPSAATAATGFTIVTIAADFSSFAIRFIADGLSGDIGGAHIHTAALGENGPVAIDLTPALNGNSIFGALPNPSPDLVDLFLTGDLYLNVHTAAFPDGEIRGQVYRLARDGYSYGICPEQEVTTATAPLATGAGMASIDRKQTNAHVMMVVSGLTGDITGAHIHGGATGTDGGVLVDLTPLFNPSGGMFTYLSDTFDQSISEQLRAGNTYVNIHTDANPGGELRGQIVKEVTCPLVMLPTSTVDADNPFETLSVSPVPTSDILNINYSTTLNADAILTIYDITGKVIHTNKHRTIAGTPTTLSVDVSEYANGFYTLTVSDGQHLLSDKFVKQ